MTDKTELNIREIKELAFGESAKGDVQAVFEEARAYFDHKVIRWLEERIVPIVEELETDADIMADMLLDEDRLEN